jgi:demethylmenaquinone methyltransferase / 2-methoxy-6-polyprenyl-1,4-benzoquinol methylase
MPGRRKTPQHIFTDVAAFYDVFNSVLSLGRASAWRGAAARTLIGQGNLFLDVGTGTGRMATAVTSLVRSASAAGEVKVIGCDINLSMLSRARCALPHDGIVLADSRQLPFHAGTFSGVCLAFSLADMDEPVAALAECRRVLRPGGRCVLLELAHPGGFAGRVYVPVLTAAVAVTARLTGASGLRSLATEIRDYPGPEWMTQTIVAAGLELVESRALDYGLARLYVTRAPSSLPSSPGTVTQGHV